MLFEDLVARGTAALDGRDAGQAVILFDRALALWRGEVLADLPEFGFVAPIAGRLQELRMSALESRMEAELLLGHHGAAVAELDRLVADNPLRERLHAERILALYRSGRQSDALGAYRQLRTMLHEELGIEPSPPAAGAAPCGVGAGPRNRLGSTAHDPRGSGRGCRPEAQS